MHLLKKSINLIYTRLHGLAQSIRICCTPEYVDFHLCDKNGFFEEFEELNEELEKELLDDLRQELLEKLCLKDGGEG